MRSVLILLAAAVAVPAQTMQERVRPYLLRALDAGNAFVGVSAASGDPTMAPASLASLYGPNLAGQTALGVAPYPPSLGGVSVQIVDSAGNAQAAQLLYVSPEQINFVLPSGMADGAATITLSNGASQLTGAVQANAVAPALFTANMNGQGVVAATAYRSIAPNPAPRGPVTVFQCGAMPDSCVSVPIDPGLDAPVTITLYATGIKGRSSDAGVTLTIGKITVPIQSITSSDGNGPMAGIDQVTFLLPLTLRGSGEVPIYLTVDGVNSNMARINIQ
ncbi:MAG TPA: hypothetical protein VKT49_02995 [Bryobacteraceae bacterium]|nr:hypothetical protein [Bryobacteraceae bacterium]